MFLYQTEQILLQISHINSKLHLCYCCFELMKDAVPKEIVASFLDPKKYLLPKVSDPKKSLWEAPPPPPPGVFSRSKKYLLPKVSDPKISLGEPPPPPPPPPPIKIWWEWSHRGNTISSNFELIFSENAVETFLLLPPSSFTRGMYIPKI